MNPLVSKFQLAFLTAKLIFAQSSRFSIS